MRGKEKFVETWARRIYAVAEAKTCFVGMEGEGDGFDCLKESRMEGDS